MRFAELNWLYLSWILPIVLLFCVWQHKKYSKTLSLLAPSHLLSKLTVVPAYIFVRYTLILMAILSFILALMRPQWGYTWEEIPRKENDIIVAIDLSDSMLAQDISPSRLQFAKNKIIDLLNLAKGERLGLVAFAGRAFLQCPLTEDQGAFKLFLDYLDTDFIPVKGTSLGNAIEVSLRAFDLAKSTKKTLILLTDGEDLAAEGLKASEKAKAAGVVIYTLGIATPKGAPIPNKIGGDFKKNQQGELVFSKLGEADLKKIAENTGGQFFYASLDDSDLQKIYGNALTSEENTGISKVKRPMERFQFPLLIGFVLLLFEFFLGLPKKVKPMLGLFLLAFLPGRVSHASPFFTERFNGEKAYKKENYSDAIKSFEHALVDDPNNAELLFNLGAAYYKNKEYSKAETSWKNALEKLNAQKNSTDKAKGAVHYNLGNNSFRQEKLEEAAERYRQALTLNKDDKDAEKNLSLVLEELKKKKEQQNQQQQNDDKNKDKKDQKNAQQTQAQNQKEEEKKKEEQQKEQQQKEAEQKQAEAKAGGATPTPAAGPTTAPTAAGTATAELPKKDEGERKKQDAERLIDAVEDKQKEVLQKRMQQKGKPVENPYDW